ncbi:MAG TPA: hypothetical protein VM759_08400 [Longimicrobium sp.]|nr:hypothetical protein [Longimicrobium sp.]
MKKLTLDPEMLLVESFTPEGDPRSSRGTVAAHQDPPGDSEDTNLDILTCAGSCPTDCADLFALTYDGGATCVYSCPGRCFLTGFQPTCEH